MDLFETLESQGRLPISECKDIIRQVLMAVAELHQRGCIHKDLKLENIMCDRSPTSGASNASSDFMNSTSPKSPKVKIIDFDTVEEFADSNSPTHSTSVIGTDQYIAQEAYAGMYSPAS